MSVQNALASVAVRDLAAVLPWYRRLLGGDGFQPTPDVAEWIFPYGGGLQVYRWPERAGACSCTLFIRGMEQQIAKLDALGIDSHQRSATERLRTVMITDPDGNHFALVEPIDTTWAG